MFRKFKSVVVFFLALVLSRPFGKVIHDLARISHVKLQNCHGDISCISIRAKMASRFKTVTSEEVTKLKGAAENLNT